MALMPYAALDLETTGLDPSTHQILEIGCVIETDWVTPVESLPTFRAIVDNGNIVGESKALAMNAALIAELAACDKYNLKPVYVVLGELINWIKAQNPNPVVTFAGKNFGAFDLQFLKRSAIPWSTFRYKHRFIDVGNLFWNPAKDDCLPDLATCVSRTGVTPRKLHSAIEDCRSVIECVRAYWEDLDAMNHDLGRN